MEVPDDLVEKFDKMDADMLKDFEEDAKEKEASESEGKESTPAAAASGQT